MPHTCKETEGDRKGFIGHICGRCRAFKTIAQCVNRGSQEHDRNGSSLAELRQGGHREFEGILGYIHSEFRDNLVTE